MFMLNQWFLGILRTFTYNNNNNFYDNNNNNKFKGVIVLGL